VPRHLADQFEFAFLDDSLGVCLFQGGVKVCRGKQQHGQGNQVHWQGQTPPIGQSVNQADCGGRTGSGRGCGRCCTSCCGVKVSRG